MTENRPKPTPPPVKADEVTDDPKCENHPQRKAVTYTHGGVVQSLCEECTPDWYKDDE